MVCVFCKVTKHGMVTVIIGLGRAMHAPTLENGKFKIENERRYRGDHWSSVYIGKNVRLREEHIRFAKCDPSPTEEFVIRTSVAVDDGMR